MKKILYVIIVALILPVSALANDSFPSFPMSFYGDVKLNSVVLPVNSKIYVYSADELKGEIVINEQGVYGYDSPLKQKLLVGEYSGSEIIFKYSLPGETVINSGNSVIKYSGAFEAGKTSNLNINFSAASASSGSVSGGSGGSGGGSSGGSVGSTPTILSGINLETPAPPDKIVIKKVVPLQTDNTQVDQPGIEKNIVTDTRSEQLQQILDDASVVLNYVSSDLAPLVETKKNQIIETAGLEKYIKPLALNVSDFSESAKVPLLNFVVYGTVSTKVLGAGERAGVVNSYKAAFGKLPQNQAEWEDVIKIANGRWPSERSDKKEGEAQKEFKNIYKRESDMDNQKDNAAVTVMSYGLRPSDRNLNSEKAGIKIFKGIYKKAPLTATDWDIVRAIAYSGATR
jgi:hypothetical protein